MKKLLHYLCIMSAPLLFTAHQAMAAGQVNVYNWGSSIAHDTNKNFEKQTGITVHYSEFDSNDTLMAKLLTGNSGFDVVVPSDAYFGRQLQAGLFRKLDKSKIPNLAKLDPNLMKILTTSDPGNQYGVPLNWGTDGIGINREKVEAILGKNAPLDSWDLVFDPRYASKLAKCGISFLDSPVDVFGMGLNYLKKNPLSTNPADYQAVFEMLKKVRPYIGEFNSANYGNDLARGEVCVAFGYSGDINVARLAALSSKQPYHIQYILPREGSVIWFDVMAVPKSAPDPDEAMKWINHVISEKEAAALSNETNYPTAVPGAKAFINKTVLEDTTVFPDATQMKRLFTVKALPADILRLETHLWQQLKVR